MHIKSCLLNQDWSKQLFRYLSTLVTIPNNILQGEIKKAGINSGRFVINTTVGILGFIDVAQHLGFPEYEKEDYGQSSATMGVGPGCYLVLPFRTKYS